MIKKVSLISFSSFFIIPFLYPDLIYALCSENRCSFEDSLNASKKNKHNKYLTLSVGNFKNNLIQKNIEDLLQRDDSRLDEMLDKIIVSEPTNRNNKYYVDIESNIQYEEDDIYFAEGNVIIKFNNSELRSDKITFHKKTRLFTAEGNIIYKKKNQYFTAEFMQYNFANKKGKITNVYAVLDIKNLGKDFDYKIKDEEVCLVNIPNFVSPVQEVQLLESNNIRFENKKKLDALQFKFPSFTRWRMRAEEIIINDNKWESDHVFFTNDPFNKPQLIFESKDFTAEVFQNRTKLKSRAGFLRIENKLRIPLGRRTINSNDGLAVWGVGRQKSKKDGAYILRNFEPIKFNKTLIDLQPYFLIERGIMGKTNAFIAEDSSINSDKVEDDISFADMWALDVKMQSKINKWELNLESSFHSLNPKRFQEGESYISLSRKLFQSTYPKSENNGECFSKNEGTPLVDKFTSSYNLDFGLFSLYRREKVYTAYGAKLISEKKSRKNRKENIIYSSLELGQYESERKDHKEFITLSRYKLIGSLSNTYKVFGPDYSKENISKEYKYSPKVVDKGIYITSKLSGAHLGYSNNSHQSGLSASIRPTFVFGDLKNNFLDYTYISLMGEYSLKDGESPFGFDNLNSDARLTLNFGQQIFGPLIFEFDGTINLNGSSSNFGKIYDENYSIGISRRAYSFFAYYKPDKEEIGFNLKIFDFDFKGNPKEFEY